MFFQSPGHRLRCCIGTIVAHLKGKPSSEEAVTEATPTCARQVYWSSASSMCREPDMHVLVVGTAASWVRAH